jgi:ADP-dependent NAD(P)H-hydrate dehydratase
MSPSAPEPVVVTPTVLRDWRLPEPSAGKEARGRTLIVGGSTETPGAVLLAAEAALRAGAGKLQVATVASLAPYVAMALPEAMVRGLPETDGGLLAPSGADAVAELAQSADSVLVGPGMADPQLSAEFLTKVVPHLGEGTLVLDALALSAVTEAKDCLHQLSGNAVLTPNPSELAITLGVDAEEVDRDPVDATLRLARTARAVVSCGGAVSTTAAPDGRVWRDDSGGVGLGVSGSGDVMAGVVAGLAARGASPEQAAVWGAHLHGRAGDRLASAIGRVGFLAREVPVEIPHVLAELET